MKNCQVFIALAAVFLICNGHGSAAAAVSGGPPEEIVRKYCSLDAEGARLSSDTFGGVSPLITWGEEPGWDSSVIIAGFDVGRAAVSGDEARVTVRYNKLGEEGGGFRKEKAVEEVVFILVRGDKGWMIREPLLNPHVSKAAIIRHLKGLIKDSPKRRQELEAVIKKIEAAAR